MTARGHFQIAPAAQITAIRAFRQAPAIGPTTRHRPLGTHGSVLIILVLTRPFVIILSLKKSQERNMITLERI
jgi:hypothetical protein